MSRCRCGFVQPGPMHFPCPITGATMGDVYPSEERIAAEIDDALAQRVARQTIELVELRRDRDEWRAQHENLLAIYRAQVAGLTTEESALQAVYVAHARVRLLEGRPASDLCVCVFCETHLARIRASAPEHRASPDPSSEKQVRK